ncbi:Alpha/Beta hydrolase protein [Exophiala viscosa]|uniref:Alpha/Beta hydrolase protein n=1 Tax=Exophiala viscosa TaxID=2486360 RepID=UPI0021944867|nr:Alpha/Beta hydrolase protein [Exophiala viscosa]
MAANTDLTVDARKFDPAAISEDSHAFNAKLIDLMAQGPKWYEVGAEKYRQMRAAGETPFPKATFLDSAEDFTIPSRDAGRSIPCRILKPQHGGKPKALFMHIHGGGWVLQDEKSQDPTLQDTANKTGTLVISVGYRLAPEDAFPAGPNDCYDAAEWLVDNSESKFGVPMAFLGGESAGGHLSMLVVLHLLQHQQQKYADFQFKGLLLHYGCYSMLWTPRVHTFRKGKQGSLILDQDLMDHFIEVFLPGKTEEEKKDPSISPLYADFEALRSKLPPALFTCGTEDCLLDDTMFMSTKWLMAGGEGVVKIIPGAPHGYIMFPRTIKGSGSEEGLTAVEEFISSKLGDAHNGK